MMNWLFQGQGPTFRIAMGLAGTLISLLLIASVAGLLPDGRNIEDQGRARLAEVLAINSSIFITLSDMRRLESTLKVVVERNDDIQSAGVRRENGKSIITIGEHDANWLPDDRAPGQLSVPILEGKTKFYFFRQEHSQFFAEAEKSLGLNSSEGTTVGLIGYYTALAGEWDRGLSLMRKAIALNPHYPGYYHLVFGAAHLREGKYEEALLEYEKMALPEWFLAQIPLVAANGLLHRERETQTAMAHLLELRPGYNLEQCAEDLRRFGLPEDVVKPLLEGLKIAGLPRTS